MWLERSEGGTEHRTILCFVLLLASLYTLVLVRGWSDAYFILYKLSNVVWKYSFFCLSHNTYSIIACGVDS